MFTASLEMTAQRARNPHQHYPYWSLPSSPIPRAILHTYFAHATSLTQATSFLLSRLTNTVNLLTGTLVHQARIPGTHSHKQCGLASTSLEVFTQLLPSPVMCRVALVVNLVGSFDLAPCSLRTLLMLVVGVTSQPRMAFVQQCVSFDSDRHLSHLRLDEQCWFLKLCTPELGVMRRLAENSLPW